MKQTAAENTCILRKTNYSLSDKSESQQMPQYCWVLLFWPITNNLHPDSKCVIAQKYLLHYCIGKMKQELPLCNSGCTTLLYRVIDTFGLYFANLTVNDAYNKLTKLLKKIRVLSTRLK